MQLRLYRTIISPTQEQRKPNHMYQLYMRVISACTYSTNAISSLENPFTSQYNYYYSIHKSRIGMC